MPSPRSDREQADAHERAGELQLTYALKHLEHWARGGLTLATQIRSVYLARDHFKQAERLRRRAKRAERRR